MTCAVVWFRRDLRLADNPALTAALSHSERVIPLYIHAPDEESPWAPGSASRLWLHHSLEALDARLRDYGSRLILRQGPARTVIEHLFSETRVESVWWNRLYEPAIVKRDSNLKQWLRTQGLKAHSFNAALLHDPWEVETGEGKPYKVFTPFWNKIKTRPVREALAEPDDMPAVCNRIGSESITDLDLMPGRDWTKRIMSGWTPGELGAHSSFEPFLECGLPGYKQGRDLPAASATSRLSPHLHWGEIGPVQVWHTVKEYAAQHSEYGLGVSSETYLSELAWREFAHHLLYHFPQTPLEPLDKRFKEFPWAKNYAARLRAWQRGETGIPIVDAGMRQLWASGWMHNRVRMVVASFLTKNLLIPWQEGARWFWDTLVDADLANNTLGWQWTAGSGADAAPYFRIFNPVRQGERFDEQGDYVRCWIPELNRLPGEYIHAPWTAPAETLASADIELGKHYPAPIVDLRDSRQRALAAFDTIKNFER